MFFYEHIAIFMQRNEGYDKSMNYWVKDIIFYLCSESVLCQILGPSFPQLALHKRTGTTNNMASKFVVVNWDDDTSSVHKCKDLCFERLAALEPVQLQVKNSLWKGTIDSVWDTKIQANMRYKEICGDINIFREEASGGRQRKKKVDDDFVSDENLEPSQKKALHEEKSSTSSVEKNKKTKNGSKKKDEKIKKNNKNKENNKNNNKDDKTQSSNETLIAKEMNFMSKFVLTNCQSTPTSQPTPTSQQTASISDEEMFSSENDENDDTILSDVDKLIASFSNHEQDGNFMPVMDPLSRKTEKQKHSAEKKLHKKTTKIVKRKMFSPQKALVLKKNAYNFSPKKSVPKVCQRCIIKANKIQELEKENGELQKEISRLNETIENGSYIENECPRSGMMPMKVAEKYKMEEISMGVYVTQTQLAALGGKSGTGAASLLLDCFYSKTEQLNMTVNGTYNKEKIHPTLLEAIICYVCKNHPDVSASKVKLAIRNKLSSYQSKQKSKTKQPA